MKRLIARFVVATVFGMVLGSSVAQEGESATTIYSANFEDGTQAGDWELGTSSGGSLEPGVFPSQWNIGPMNPFLLVIDLSSNSIGSLNFNRWYGANNFNTEAVSAGSPAIKVEGHADASLRFRCAFGSMATWIGASTQANKVYDHRFGRILSLDGAVLASLPLDDKACPGIFHEHKIQLDPSWGSIRVEFRVETEAGFIENSVSWSVDDVIVEGHSQAPESMVAAGEESKSENAGGGGSCGCVGLEAILLLVVLAAARRRR